MSEIRQFRQNKQIVNGITAETNLKMFDIIPGQHENLATNTNEQVKISIAQTFCDPVAVCSTNNPPNGHYTATCINFPDFAVSFVDSDSVRHNLVGLKLRVIFEHGITYGSVASGTFPTLSINGSEALPLLAQGKTMAQGAIVAGQSVEFTIIPYGNSIAFDADSNVRENTNDYTIYTDGRNKPDITMGNFSINMPRSTIQSQTGNYVKIGNVVFASVTLKISATTTNNDYFTLSSSMPPMDTNKQAFGAWHTFSGNGYGSIQNSNNSNCWFIYNNAEYNVGQKTINDGGKLVLTIVYFTN